MNDTSRIRKLEYRYRKLEHYVMETKEFEKIVFFSLLFFYAYIGIHIGLWIFGALTS